MTKTRKLTSCRPFRPNIVGEWDMSNAIKDNIVERKN